MHIHVSCGRNPWTKDQRQSIMRFLNTATHPGTLFSKIRRGSREDGLSGCDEVDEYAPPPTANFPNVG